MVLWTREHTVKTSVFTEMFKFNTPGCSMLVAIETHTNIKGFYGYHGTTPKLCFYTVTTQLYVIVNAPQAGQYGVIMHE